MQIIFTVKNVLFFLFKFLTMISGYFKLGKVDHILYGYHFLTCRMD